jgi:hypothetical protein
VRRRVLFVYAGNFTLTIAHLKRNSTCDFPPCIEARESTQEKSEREGASERERNHKGEKRVAMLLSACAHSPIPGIKSAPTALAAGQRGCEMYIYIILFML